jgi:excisionase family DNA binding protein
MSALELLAQALRSIARDAVRDELATSPSRAIRELIAVDEWARRHGVSRSSAWEWVRSGRLPSRKLGRARRVAADAELGPGSHAARAARRLGLVK